MLLRCYVPVREGTIWTEWTAGGPYVDLTFPGARSPSEVINVWCDKHNTSHVPHTLDALTRVVWSWAIAMRQDDPGWFARYCDNAT
jgi:hypothetical protein